MKTIFAVFAIITTIFLAPLHIYAQQSEQRALVQSFSFTGNTAFTSEALSEVIKEFQGKELTLTELQVVAEKVADYYHQRGYFLAKVILPEQSVDNGNFTLQILEGKIGQITIAGNKSYRGDFLLAYFGSMTKEGIIQQNSLESTLLILNDLPGLKAKSILRAGEEQGATDIVIDVEESPQNQGAIEINNFSSRNWRSASFTNIGQRGNSLFMRVVNGNTPDDISFMNAAYSAPADARGTRLNMYMLNGDFGVGQAFAPLNITGKASAVGIALTRPILKTRAKSVTAEIGFDMRDSEQNMLGYTTSSDSIRVLRFGMHRNTENSKSRTYTSLFLQQGLGDMFGGMDDNDPQSSRPACGADGRFTKFNFNSTRVESLSPRSFLITRLSGQLSSRSLVAGEQMAIGGPDSVRGYYPSEYLGDYGVQASLEARFASSADRLDKFQTALFLDWAWIDNKESVPGRADSASLTGAGFGIRANMSNDISVRADLGFALGRKPSGGGTASPYIQVSKRL